MTQPTIETTDFDTFAAQVDPSPYSSSWPDAIRKILADTVGKEIVENLTELAKLGNLHTPVLISELLPLQPFSKVEPNETRVKAKVIDGMHRIVALNLIGMPIPYTTEFPGEPTQAYIDVEIVTPPLLDNNLEAIRALSRSFPMPPDGWANTSTSRIIQNTTYLVLQNRYPVPDSAQPEEYMRLLFPALRERLMAFCDIDLRVTISEDLGD